MQTEGEDVTRQKKTIAEVRRRTRLPNHHVQKMLEALVEVWSEELASEGQIELESFLVLEVKHEDRGERPRALLVSGKLRRAPRAIKKLTVRPSKSLKAPMRRSCNENAEELRTP